MKKHLITAIAVILAISLAVFLIPNKSESPVIENVPDSEPRPGNARVLEVKEKIVGTWQSQDDTNYTVSYFDDSTLQERYQTPEGEIYVDTTGGYIIYSADDQLMLGTDIEGETYEYIVVEFDDLEMTIRLVGGISDNHFKKVE